MLEAISAIFSPSVLLLLLVGCVIGIVFGAIPGLSGAGAIILLMPPTYRMPSNLAIAFLIALWVGGCSGSFIASILLGIPGEAASIATVYDGHPMAQKGEAVRALSAGLTANFIGTVPSIIVAMVACPLIARAAMMLGPWEYFGLGFCAITLVITLSKGNIPKGMISAGLGFALTCVGFAPIDGQPRFSFDSYYLMGGFSLTYIMMGVFAAGTILLEYARSRPDGAKPPEQAISRYRFPIKDIKDNVVNIIRSWFIGLWIGFLPGMGAGLSNVVAYAQAKNSSKHPEAFGKGTVEGVFAPEVANNASIGGAIIPMVALGIPGDTATAFLLGGLTIHGIEAGPLMIKNNATFVNVLFLAVMFAAIIVFVLEACGMRLFPKILQIPRHYLFPAIITVCFIGAFANGNTIFDVAMVVVFSVVGILLAWGEFPTSPFILSFILGPMLEQNLRKAISYADNGAWSFFTRPISCILLIFAVFSVVWSFVKARRKTPEAEQ